MRVLRATVRGKSGMFLSSPYSLNSWPSSGPQRWAVDASASPCLHQEGANRRWALSILRASDQSLAHAWKPPHMRVLGAAGDGRPATLWGETADGPRRLKTLQWPRCEQRSGSRYQFKPVNVIQISCSLIMNPPLPSYWLLLGNVAKSWRGTAV